MLFKLKCFALSLTLFASSTTTVFPQTGIAVPELAGLDTDFQNWMSTHTLGALGGTLVVSKNGKLVYARSFGKADIAKTTDAQPYNLYRIASMSKSVTSIMIMRLIQEGKMSISNKVYGTGGILTDSYYTNGVSVQDSRVLNITVQHLLEHTSGFVGNTNVINRNGDSINTGDLIPFSQEIAAKLGEPAPAKLQTLAKIMKGQKLGWTPGTGETYNNCNFIILSAIIEKVSGMTFDAYLQSILNPQGIYDVMLQKSMFSQKHERDVEYPKYPTEEEKYANTYSFYGDGSLVPWAYGGISYELAAGGGGISGNLKDLVKLINMVDGQSSVPDILNSTTRSLMLQERTGVNGGYAKGWGVNGNGDFYHNGGGPGHISVWGYLNQEGMGFAAIINGFEVPGSWMEGDIINMVRKYANYTMPSHDLFLCPSLNANNINITTGSSTSATISWANGNGNNRLVVIKAASQMTKFPLDGTNYTANASMGAGSNLGDGSFVVYNGTGSGVTVSNLAANTVYHVRVIEYNKTTATGNHPLYQLGANPVKHFSTSGTNSANLTVTATNGSVSQSTLGTAKALGSKVVLIATPASGYMFSGWSGAGLSGKTNPLEIVMDADKSVTANFVPYVAQQILSIRHNEGYVKSTPAGALHSNGSTVQVEAFSKYHNFMQWEEGLGTNNPLSITMNGFKKAYSNWFVKQEYCLEAEQSNGQALFAPYQVLADANASGGQYISVPNGNGDLGSTPANSIATFGFNVPYQNSYNIWLRIIAPSSSDNNISIGIDNGTYANYSPSSTTSWKWVKAQTVSLAIGDHELKIARREDGVRIDKVFIALSSTATPTNMGCTISQYELVMSAQNGTIAKLPAQTTYNAGSNVVLTATPNSGDVFAGWSGDVAGTANPLTVKMDANKRIIANFSSSVSTYTLTTNTSGSGTVAKSPNQTSYASGTVVTLTATPASGFQFTGWSGAASGTANPITVTMDANKTLTATFTAISTTYTLTANTSGSGTVAKSPNQTSYASGTVVTVTATPSSGYQFTGWSGAASGTANPISVTMDANKTLKATFSQIVTGGDICVEAESALGQSTFSPYQVYNDANASGGKYIMVPNGTGNQSSPPTTSIATLNFNVATAGIYNIWLRCISPTSSDNDMYLSVDAASYSSFTAGPFTSWTWKKWTSKSLSAGTHTLSVARKEDGLQIDKVLLTTTANTPSGMGCTGSARMENEGQSVEMEEWKENALFLSPNPSSNTFSLASVDKTITYISVNNALGVAVFTSVNIAKGTRTEFGSDFEAGMYTVLVKYEDGKSESLKVIKTK